MAKTVVIPTNPADIEKIRGALQEIADAFTRMTAERELVKDIKAMLKEDFELPPKYITKLAKTFYNQDFEAQQTESEDFDELWFAVTSKK